MKDQDREKIIKIVLDGHILYKWSYDYVININAHSLANAINMLTYEISDCLDIKHNLILDDFEKKDISEKISSLYREDLFYR